MAEQLTRDERLARAVTNAKRLCMLNGGRLYVCSFDIDEGIVQYDCCSESFLDSDEFHAFDGRIHCEVYRDDDANIITEW